MMVNTPSTAALDSLGAMLELLKIATDPKLSQEMLGKFAEERKAFDDAVAAANRRIAEAVSLEQLAAISVSNANASMAAMGTERNEMDERAAAMSEAQKSLEADLQHLSARKAEIAKVARANANLKDEQDSFLASELAKIEMQRKDLDDKMAELSNKFALVDALKVEYEAKLAQFKALAA